MKVGQEYFKIESSFLAMEKDFALITNKMIQNQRLLKLLYYTQPDAQKGKDLTAQQIHSMIHKQIRIVPKIDIDQNCPTMVIISFDNFTPNAKNPKFRDCTINFDVLCHPDHWNLGNFQLRPYKIIGEIDAMFNNTKMTGIGELQFITCNNLVLNDQLMGLTAIYSAIYGGEDEVDPLVKP